MILSPAQALEMGAPLPEVQLPDQAGKPVDLKNHRDDPYVLVFFYPKADTPGCTKQACSLRDAYEELTQKGVRVFGVSRDSVDAQKAFAEKFNLPYTLLADEAGEGVKAFGVPALGKFAKRQAFLFQKGKLVWKDESASTEKQAEDVLKVLKGVALNPLPKKPLSRPVLSIGWRDRRVPPYSALA